MADLNIYYDLTESPPASKITCWCTQWKRDGQEVTITTFLNSSDKDTLFDNLRPGAVKELYNVLGEKCFVDTTWQDINTLKIEAVTGKRLDDMYRDVKIGVKSLSYEPINPYWWTIKIIGIIMWEDTT